MKNKFWFTLVELLVVIGIISIISVFSIWWLNIFLKNQDFKAKISNIENILSEYDLKIKEKEIFYNKIILEKNKSYFLVYEDIEENKVKIENNKIKIENIFSDDNKKIEVSLYKNNKFSWNYLFENWQKIENKIVDKNQKIDIKNNNLVIETIKNNNYKISVKNFDWTSYNFSLKNYSLKEELNLKDLSNSEKKWDLFQKLEIENKNWQKKILLDKKQQKQAYLFFDNDNQKENFLLLKN